MARCYRMNGMTLADVLSYFETPGKYFLVQEEAIGYICQVLTTRPDSYGSELQVLLKNTGFELSSTTLYAAINFLKKQGMIINLHREPMGKGRPQKVMQLVESHRDTALQLAALWHQKTGFTVPIDESSSESSTAIPDTFPIPILA